MPQSKVIYLGIKGRVIAMEAATGRRLWEQRLKGSDFVNVVVDGDCVYASTQGEIFCLDATSGAQRWHDPLRGSGLGRGCIAGKGIAANEALLAARAGARQPAASSASASCTASN